MSGCNYSPVEQHCCDGALPFRLSCLCFHVRGRVATSLCQDTHLHSQPVFQLSGSLIHEVQLR